MKSKLIISKPLISIITPSYNSGRFIEDCIKSILAQDYPNIEHIIQDGDSTDLTKKILKKYQRKQYKNKIKIFIEPDKGQSDALNRLIQKSKGDIILVLNADDMLMPYACTWGVEQMKKYPNVGVIYGDTYIINENSQITDILKSYDFDFEKLLCVELVPPAQAAFIRRLALKKVGFWADNTLDTCPDYEMWVRIIQKFPMKHVWGVITKYRIHDTPQLDSRQPRTTHRFIEAKRKVMDRLFNSPTTPKRIKKLRRRAYASLFNWAASNAFQLKDYPSAALYLTKAFIIQPNLKHFKRLVFVMKDSPLFFLKTILNLHH